MREIFVGEELKLKLMQFCDYLTDPKTLILYIDILEGNVDVRLVLSIMYLSPIDAEPMLSSTPLEYVFNAEIQLTNQNRVQTKWRHLVKVDKELKKQKVVAWSESAMIECLDKMRSLTEVPCFVQDATTLVLTPASSNSDSRCDDIRDDFWTHLKRQKAYSVFEIIPFVFDEIESKPPKTIQQWSLFSESMRKQVYKLSVPYELDDLVSHIVLMYMRPKPELVLFFLIIIEFYSKSNFFLSVFRCLNEKNVLYDEYKISISRNKENFLVFFFLKTNVV